MSLVGWKIFLLVCFVLAVVSVIGSTWLLYRAYKLKQEQRKLKDVLAYEIDQLLTRIGEVSEDNVELDESHLGVLNSKKYLATLVTVLVKKSGGEIVLCEEDFENIGLDDYISVYSDVENNSLILMLNSLLPAMPGVADEDVYH